MTRMIARIFLAFWLCLVPASLTFAPVTAQAQEVALTEADQEDWQRLASRAEEAVATARASTPALQTLRLDLVRWREIFLAARQHNSRSIANAPPQTATHGPET